MTRKIHIMWRMIAINDGRQVLAVFKSAFRDLVEELMPELDLIEKTSFKMAATMSTVVDSEHRKQMPEWENLFIRRLKERMDKLGHHLVFKLDPKEVKDYLPDILESYRGNHFEEFGYSVDDLHGSKSTVVTIKVFDPPKLWERALKTHRVPSQKLLIPLDDIASATGTSISFELHTLTGTVRFKPNGAVVEE
jgi:hypothetical protein